MIIKLICGPAKHAGRRFEARKAHTLIAYSVNLVPLNQAQRADPRINYVLDHHHRDNDHRDDEHHERDNPSLGEIAQYEAQVIGEKVAFWGTRNIQAANVEDIQAEMMALVACGRSNNSPIAHIVVSWQKGEKPNRRQAKAAIATIMELLGGMDLKLVWSMHRNTDYFHLHLVVNRIRPGHFTTCELGAGWVIDSLHQAIALVEARQGWATEVNGLYTANTNGELRVRSTGKLVRSKDGRQLRQRGDRAEEMKIRRLSSPVASFAPVIVAASQNWPELHERFADDGYGYRVKGSGAVLHPLAGGDDITLSFAVEGASHKAMVARLGPFIPATSATAQADHEFAEYTRRLRKANVDVRAYRKATWDLLDRTRRNIEKGSTHGQEPGVREVLRLAIAEEFARVRLQLNQEYNDSVQKLALARFANAEEWMAKGRPDVPAAPLPTVLAGTQEGIHNTPPGYVRHDLGPFDTYTRPKCAAPSITDFRAVIVVRGDDEDLLAGLQMAAARWGRVEAVADASTCERIGNLARKNGIDVVVSVTGVGPQNPNCGSLPTAIPTPAPEPGIHQVAPNEETTNEPYRPPEERVPETARDGVEHFRLRLSEAARSGRTGRGSVWGLPGIQVAGRRGEAAVLLPDAPRFFMVGGCRDNNSVRRPRNRLGFPHSGLMRESEAVPAQPAIAPSVAASSRAISLPGNRDPATSKSYVLPAVGQDTGTRPAQENINDGRDADRGHHGGFDPSVLAAIAQRNRRGR